ncbi:hypothetical protein ZYGR_0S00740 [Zygosaccharomyces rouxii]|uniref:ZYRO0F04114p n=2 Tax=Zygosaccharomyces rouxii TaxID=4956 RepID=C5DXD3_ZYGRC|nr:uncharacterized protein ZYRO0F04114g [Zygosaccharomyces rouxii]KAH9199207.1 hypothetical protein LQ764DRAFT_225458 [Zygosaccharomyces rouxii]GAV49941.1 hypothetical protein ZYGR_0S00740 [Zygosaccharomyces rouxii]CAR28444.1 ZYRO0F04114p [Zygosaccharomyces rouxii]
MLLDRFPRFHTKNKRKEQLELQVDGNNNTEVGMESGIDSYEVLQQPQPLMFNSGVDEKMMDNDDDVISMDPFVRTPISTPMDTQPQFNGSGLGGPTGVGQPQPPFPPYLRTRGRQNTTSSLSSSISDFHAGANSGSGWNSVSSHSGVSGSGSFTPQFLALMLEVYQNVCSDPTVTPFDSNNPPSGILDRVAKIAVEESENKGVEIGYERNSWLLTLIRHRLLEEVHKDSYLSRSGSAVSIPQLPPHWMDSAAPFEAPSRPDGLRRQPSQDYFNGWNFTSARPGSNGGGNLIRTRSNSSQLLLNQPGLVRTRSDTNNSGMCGLTPTNSETNLSSSGFGGVLNGFPTRQRSIGLGGPQVCNGMNSPINPPPMASMEDPGITLRRKRESLRFKR